MELIKCKVFYISELCVFIFDSNVLTLLKTSFMKKVYYYLWLSFVVLTFLSSCGISKEVRSASTNLLAKQKVSLEAHITFHEVTLQSLNQVLEAEEARSERVYEESIEKYHQAMLDELKNIYENQQLSAAEKKVQEEKARQSIMGYIKKAENNKNKREELIKEAKDKLLTASGQLIEGERVKSQAIEKLDAYLQAKRPSERLLELIDLDLDKYSSYVTKANEAIQQAGPLIDKLKK
jgi:predicted transcriptional regulator with HTH domain